MPHHPSLFRYRRRRPPAPAFSAVAALAERLGCRLTKAHQLPTYRLYVLLPGWGAGWEFTEPFAWRTLHGAYDGLTELAQKMAQGARPRRPGWAAWAGVTSIAITTGAYKGCSRTAASPPSEPS